jgi:hypothetical protein
MRKLKPQMPLGGFSYAEIVSISPVVLVLTVVLRWQF